MRIAPGFGSERRASLQLIPYMYVEEGCRIIANGDTAVSSKAECMVATC
jgi:hypothetical protein